MLDKSTLISVHPCLRWQTPQTIPIPYYRLLLINMRENTRTSQSCGLYALCKILLNAPCLFSAKSSINLSWHRSYKRNWVPVGGTDSAFFGLTIDREGLLNKIYWLFFPTLGVSLGACVIPSCGRPVTPWKEGCHLVFVVFLSCALKICRDEWVS